MAENLKLLLDPFTWGNSVMKGRGQIPSLLTPDQLVSRLFKVDEAIAQAFINIVYMIDSFHDIDEKSGESAGIKSYISNYTTILLNDNEKFQYSGEAPSGAVASRPSRGASKSVPRYGQKMNGLEKNIFTLLAACFTPDIALDFMNKAEFVFRGYSLNGKGVDIKDLNGMKGNIIRLLEMHFVMSNNKDYSYVRLFKGSQPNVVDWVKDSGRSVSLDVAALPSRVRRNGREIKEYNKNTIAGRVFRREVIDKVLITPAQFFDGASTIGIDDGKVKYVFIKSNDASGTEEIKKYIPTGNIVHKQSSMVQLLGTFTLYSYGFKGGPAGKSLNSGGVIMMRNPVADAEFGNIAKYVIVSTSTVPSGFKLVNKTNNVYLSPDNQVVYLQRGYGPSAGELTLIAQQTMPKGLKDQKNQLKFAMTIFEYKRCGDGMQGVFNTQVNQLPNGAGDLYIVKTELPNAVKVSDAGLGNLSGSNYLATQDYLAAAIGIMNGAGIILDGKSFGYRVYMPMWMEYQSVTNSGATVSLFEKYRKETARLMTELPQNVVTAIKADITDGKFAYIRPGFSSSLSKELKRINSTIDISSLTRLQVRKMRLLMKFPTPFIMGAAGKVNKIPVAPNIGQSNNLNNLNKLENSIPKKNNTNVNVNSLNNQEIQKLEKGIQEVKELRRSRRGQGLEPNTQPLNMGGRGTKRRLS